MHSSALGGWVEVQPCNKAVHHCSTALQLMYLGIAELCGCIHDNCAGWCVHLRMTRTQASSKGGQHERRGGNAQTDTQWAQDTHQLCAGGDVCKRVCHPPARASSKASEARVGWHPASTAPISTCWDPAGMHTHLDGVGAVVVVSPNRLELHIRVLGHVLPAAKHRLVTRKRHLQISGNACKQSQVRKAEWQNFRSRPLPQQL